MSNPWFKYGIYAATGVVGIVSVGLVSGAANPNLGGASDTSSARQNTSGVFTWGEQLIGNWVGTGVNSKKEKVLWANAAGQPQLRPSISKWSKPQFGTLSLQHDGSVQVAGNALPNSKIEVLQADGKVVGMAVAGPEGGFIVNLEMVLTSGDHVLRLTSTDSTGIKTLSTETGLLHIPEGEGDVLAMIGEVGGPGRIFETAGMESSPEKASTNTADVSVPVPSKRPDQMSSKHRVLFEAVEVEGDKVFVVGMASPGDLVRVYVDNVDVGTARGSDDKRFTLTKNIPLTPGKHIIRADVINEQTGGVQSRAEVDLFHQTKGEVASSQSEEGVKMALKTTVLPTSDQMTDKKPESMSETDQEAMPDKPKADDANDADQAMEDKNAEEGAQENASMKKIDPGYELVGKKVTVRRGDSLWKISRKSYGSGKRYTVIYNANRDQIKDPHQIYIGQIFDLPQKVVE